MSLVARSGPALDEIVPAADPERAAAFPCDLGDADALDGLVGRIETARGPVDVLVNNAGVDHTGAFTAMTAADVRTVIGVNLVATAELCRQALPRMTARGRGHIVNVSSIGGSLAERGPHRVLRDQGRGEPAHRGSASGAEGHARAARPSWRSGPSRTEMIDDVRGYGPPAASVRRLERAGLSPELDPRVVAAAMADAIASGRRHVRLPRRQAPVSMIAEAPRRIGEWLTLGLDTRPTP